MLSSLCKTVAGDMTSVVMNREQENERMEEEMNGYRDDIDSMLDTFRQKEREMNDEMEILQVGLH